MASKEQKHWSEEPFQLVHTPMDGKPLDKQPDVFEISAADMALFHNILIRGMNAIHKQALYIQPKDEKSFLAYCDYWAKGIEVHHDGEEAELFPKIEEASGQKGIMEANIKQHALFDNGLKSFHDYIKACINGEDNFDGERIIRLLEAFGAVMANHLAEEIPTLMSLRDYGEDKFKDLYKWMGTTAEHTMKGLGFTAGVPLFLAMHDRSYEENRWEKLFPPAPWVVMALVRNVFYHLYADMHKFAPADNQSRLRPAPYARPTSS